MTLLIKGDELRRKLMKCKISAKIFKEKKTFCKVKRVRIFCVIKRGEGDFPFCFSASLTLFHVSEVTSGYFELV